MRIVALGASGNAGTAIATLLAPCLSAADELVLAGRNTKRLDAVAAELPGPAKISTTAVDVDDLSRVKDVVTGADLVIVTVSRPDLTGALAEVVLSAGADWFDTMLSTPTKLAALHALEPAISAAGRCFVTDGGFHPGLPGVLVRWAGEHLDQLIEADVWGGMRIDWSTGTLSDSTVEEMLDEFTDFDMSTWIDGKRRALRWTECPTINFGQPIGRKIVVPMQLAEMDDFPQQFPGLQRCGFYISGFGPVMDYLALPVLMGMARVPRWRPATVRLTRWAMAHFASVPPPHQIMVRTKTIGLRSGRPVAARARVIADDPYLVTAAPAVACLRRMIDRSIGSPGLHLQAHLVDPATFLSDLTSFGLTVETSVCPIDPTPTPH